MLLPGAGGPQQRAAPPQGSTQAAEGLREACLQATGGPVPTELSFHVFGGWDAVYPPPPRGERCPECEGRGRVVCRQCGGCGRANYRDTPLLPRGVRPVYCSGCRASGLADCTTCWGTGRPRAPVGFQVPGLNQTPEAV